MKLNHERFDPYAEVAVYEYVNEDGGKAGSAAPRLRRSCHYVLRPPVAQDALELTPEGKVLLRLRRPWRDGTRAIRFEPTELLERLAAMIPRPRANLLLYHGAFAPQGCCREGPLPWPYESMPSRATTAPGAGSAEPAGAERLAARASRRHRVGGAAAGSPGELGLCPAAPLFLGGSSPPNLRD